MKLNRFIGISIASTALLLAPTFPYWMNGLVVAPHRVAGLLAEQLDKTRLVLLVAALVACGLFVSFPLMLHQEPSQIATASPLVEMVREILPPDSRYIVPLQGWPRCHRSRMQVRDWLRFAATTVSPSRRYHALINAWGAAMQT